MALSHSSRETYVNNPTLWQLILIHVLHVADAQKYLASISPTNRLIGRRRLWTAIFKSCHRFSIGFRSGLWLGHFKTLTCFDLNHSIVALAVCLGSLSCWKMNLSLKSFADWIRFSSRFTLYSIWFHPSFPQFWPVSLSLLKRSIPTAWCYHHHVSLLGWWAQGDGQCWVSATHSVLHWGQKVNFWSQLTRAPSSTCLLCLPHGLWQTPNGIYYGSLSTTAFFLPLFYKSQIFGVQD